MRRSGIISIVSVAYLKLLDRVGPEGFLVVKDVAGW